MRICVSLYHFLLFLLVSWTVYNTFIYICLLLPTYDNPFLEIDIFDFWNVYLFGALDFDKFSRLPSDFYHGWFGHGLLNEGMVIFSYFLIVEGMAAYIWCNNQNVFSAFFLAITPCIAGPYLALLFTDYRVLNYGIIGIIAFYAILYNLNNYRKKHFPRLTLPTWLEWRRPDMVPSLKVIAKWIKHRFCQSK